MVVVSMVTVVGLSGCGSSDEPPATASINAAKAGKTAEPTPPKLDFQHPVVQLRTTAGDITLQLDAEKAPVTVNSFLNYVARGHYDGTVFHDVEAGFIVLGGGYDEKMQEKPTDFPCRNEAHNGLKNKRGTIALARQPNVIDSSTSMFFINVADNPMLDHQGEEPAKYGYCVFGKVIEGMEIVDKISKTPAGQVGQFPRMPNERIAIQSARRVR
jgi:cyclophilin family peptidyl-prolyl cis-trans isomerase